MPISRRSFLTHSAVGVSAIPLSLSQKSLQASENPTMGQAQYVSVNGVRTRYFEAGQGEVVLLVHGGHYGSGSSASNWMPLFPSLSKHFHVFAIDKLGMGFTDNPKSDREYKMEATVKHIYGFIKAMNIHTVHLVGSSRGGLAVARNAIDHPELVQTLTIFNSNTLAPVDPPPSLPDLPSEGPKPTRESIREQLMSNPTAFQKDFITDEYLEAQLEVALLPKLREAAVRLNQLRKEFVESNPEKVRARPALGRNSGTGWWLYEVKDETLAMLESGKLKTPTQIIWGYDDPSATHPMGSDLFEMIRKSVDRSRLHFFNKCGHGPYQEYPSEVTDIIVSFRRE